MPIKSCSSNSTSQGFSSPSWLLISSPAGVTQCRVMLLTERGSTGREGGSLQGEIMSSVLDMMSYCEHSTHSFTVGITWRQRHDFMWKPTVPVTSLLSVKWGEKKNNVSQNLLVAVFLPEWNHLVQMTLSLKETRLWQRLLWDIRRPNSTQIISWHPSGSGHLNGAFQTSWRWRGREEAAVTALLNPPRLSEIRLPHCGLGNQPQGNLTRARFFP